MKKAMRYFLTRGMSVLILLVIYTLTVNAQTEDEYVSPVWGDKEKKERKEKPQKRANGHRSTGFKSYTSIFTGGSPPFSWDESMRGISLSAGLYHKNLYVGLKSGYTLYQLEVGCSV